MKNFYVYSKCWAGNKNYLRVDFTGTKYMCQKFISNQPYQHWYFVSCLQPDKATKRYM